MVSVRRGYTLKVKKMLEKWLEVECRYTEPRGSTLHYVVRYSRTSRCLVRGACLSRENKFQVYMQNCVLAAAARTVDSSNP